MKFNWCTISVNDIDESVKFYQDIVGLSIDRRFKAGPDIEICFMGSGETKIELIMDKGHKAPGNIQGISIGFETDSVDRLLEFVKSRGIAVDSGPVQPNPHLRFFFVKDPNGLRIQFAENL
ncbi:MAG TPA: VOC family protein [Clostridia bacterium]|nr:VOC family protein [Clostridia bacterium]